ncbi:MAG: hypothetical protein ACI9T7_001289, partial [Oleiphilaceae bacterium]
MNSACPLLFCSFTGNITEEMVYQYLEHYLAHLMAIQEI